MNLTSLTFGAICGILVLVLPDLLPERIAVGIGVVSGVLLAWAHDAWIAAGNKEPRR